MQCDERRASSSEEEAQCSGRDELVPDDLSATAAQKAKAFALWKTEHPCALECWSQLKRELEGKRIALFSDYDGTLTPIVDKPDLAFMSDSMRAAVKAVASHFPAAIISGRALEKVTSFVKLAELYYAGSHGFDILGPRQESGDSSVKHQPVPWAVKLIDQVHDELLPRIALIEGASVEHNKFCVSVHYRLCPERWPEVEAALEEVLAGHEQLHVTRGRKVYEVRPKVEWDKGKALLYLLQSLGLQGGGVCIFYLGDDVSDEDAFRALTDHGLGVGILVSTHAKPTAARYTLSGPAEVEAFMWRLVEVGVRRREEEDSARPA